MVSEPSSMPSTTSSTSTSSPSITHTPPLQSPLLLLSNMLNLMSIKLDYMNYIPWRHQLVTILEADSLFDHIDGTVPQPCQFLLDTQGLSAVNVKPEYSAWKIKDKALLSLINITQTPQVFSLVVGITSS